MNSNTPAIRHFDNSEKKMFSKMLELYDAKEFPKALKLADQIQEKYPTHAETLSFKSLILNSLKRKAEATKLIEAALFKNMGNFTVWHVYGILNRANKNYDMARKAYLNALKQDTSNSNVLRDLATLQVTLNDYEGLMETRRKIVVNRPELTHFVGYITAAILAKNYASAVDIWDSI